MAETKIIPLELRALIYSHLFGSFHGYGMSPERHSLAGVIPLDIPEVRKTQRRVAALLGKTPPDFLTNKHHGTRYSHDSSSDAYNQLHSIRRLLGNGAGHRGTHPQMPPAPQNSFLGLNNDNGNDDHDDESYGLDLFDTGLFHEDTDPSAFKLPSVFATPLYGQDDVRRRRNRLVPTVSERSFVNSNLRNKTLDRRSRGPSNPSPLPHQISSLPRLDPRGRDLVSMKTGDFEDHLEGERGEMSRASKGKGHGRKSTESLRETPQDGKADMTSDMIRMMTLESERTGGSLLMDETFIPMSVTITKLTDGQKHQYEHDLYSSISGSMSVSRETSLASSDVISDDRSSSCCTCAEPHPQMLPSKSACTECLKLGSHEDWCLQKETDGKGDVTLTCMGCGKVIRKRKHHRSKRPRGATNRKSSGSAHERNPVTPETAIGKLSSSNTDTHDRRECSGKGGDRSARRTSRDNRVRFDEQVTNVPPDQSGQHSYSPLKYTSVLEDPDNNRRPKNNKKKLFVKRNQQNSESVQISELGVSVHKMAYDMALRDARMTGAYAKKGKKGKGTQPSDISSGTGTMFSYFPLLKRQRPYSESDRIDIGLTAQEARKVKPKDYMRHIFGSVKLADYYPGGKKWKDR